MTAAPGIRWETWFEREKRLLRGELDRIVKARNFYRNYRKTNTMKKIITLAILSAAMIRADAQTYGSPATIYGGTNNAQIEFSPGVKWSNNFTAYTPTKAPVFGGISSTNEVIKMQFGVLIPSTWTLLPGTSNVFVFGATTNSFAAGTNDGTWTTNLYFSTTVTLPTYFNVDTGTNVAGQRNTNTLYMH